MGESCKSISDEPPDDISGRRSRNGYYYQDLCSLRYCIRAFEDFSWQEVWCESHDDVVLYSSVDGQDRYRFIQVKYRLNSDRHWNVALLMEKPSKDSTVDDCMLCKLFNKDRYSGEGDFRLATNEGTDTKLKSFFYRWRDEAPAISLGSDGAIALMKGLQDWAPKNGRSIQDHIQRFGIEVHAGELEDMESAVREDLSRFLLKNGEKLFVEEIDSVFAQLYQGVFLAANKSLKRSGHPDRIKACDFREQALSKAQKARAGSADTSSTHGLSIVREQLKKIGATASSIKVAQDLVLAVRKELRLNQGSDVGRRLEAAILDVKAICNSESFSVLDQLEVTGRDLLRSILSRVQHYCETHSELARLGITHGVLQGIVYYLISKRRLELA